MNELETTDTSFQNDTFAQSTFGRTETDRVPLFMILVIPFIIAAVSVAAVPGLNYLVIGMGVVLACGYLMTLIKGQIHLPREIILFFAFLGWALTNFFSVEYPALFIPRLLTIVQVGIMSLILASFAINLKTTNLMLLSLLLGCFIIGFSAYATGAYQRTETGGDRVAGLAMNANLFSFAMLYSAILLLYFFKVWKSWLLKGGCIAILLIVGKLIISSGSREGFFSFLMFLFLWFYFSYKKEIFRRPATFIATGLIVVGVAIFFYLSTADSIMGKRLEEGFTLRTSSDDSRLYFYKKAFVLIAANPFMGVGLDHFKVESNTGLYSHSNYTEVFVSTGFPGGILYFSIYLTLWLRLRRLGKLSVPSNAMALVNTAKAFLLVRMAGDLTRVSYFSKTNWILLAILIGWTYFFERQHRETMGYNTEAPHE